MMTNPATSRLLGPLLVLLTLTASAAAPKKAATSARLYVNAANPTPGAGDAWATAYVSLGEALDQARQNPAITEVWVAQGTYEPTRDPFGSASPADAHDKTFPLSNGLAVYGGFAGTESVLTDRTAGHATILSGAGNNAYHVVLRVGGTAAAILDGFTIQGGNANSNSSVNVGGNVVGRNMGGGLYNAAALIASNCTFATNRATGNNVPYGVAVAGSAFGGGAYSAASSSLVLTRCSFTGNSAAGGNTPGGSTGSAGSAGGGGLYVAASAALTLTDCTFASNTAAGGSASNGSSGGSGYGFGGGLYSAATSPLLTNCTFTNNQATGGSINGGSNGGSGNGAGGGFYNAASTPALTRCTFTGNSATGGDANNASTNGSSGSGTGGGFCNAGDLATLATCAFTNNVATGGGKTGGTSNTFTGSGFGGGGYSAGAATLTGCTFTGNRATRGNLSNNASTTIGSGGSYGGGFYSAATAASLTLTDCSFRSNSATGGSANGSSTYGAGSSSGGGLYSAAPSPSLTNCTFTDNSTTGGNSANASGNAGTGAGGAFYNAATSPTLTNCAFTNNRAIGGNSTTSGSGSNGSGLGGGFYSAGTGSPTVVNSTFTANSTTSGTGSGGGGSSLGGGLYYEATAGGTVQNCILWNNTGGPANRQNLYKAGPGTALAVSASIVGDYLSTAGNNYAATAIGTANPLFANPADPDGADDLPGTADDGIALQAGSPAIDAGTASGAPATDITGAIRLNLPDQGAYEFPQLVLLSATPGAVGGPVVLTGAGLRGASVVTFSGAGNNTVVAANFTVNTSGSQLTLTVPTGAQTGPLTVTTPLGTSNGVLFTLCRITPLVQTPTAVLGASNGVTVPASAFDAGSSSTCGPVTAAVQKLGYVSQLVSEGGTLTLSTPNGELFSAVTFASYGTPTGVAGSYAQNGNCHAATSQAVVTAALVGRSTGTLAVANGTFASASPAFNGDPCPGTAKWLAVTAAYPLSSPAPSLAYTCAELGPNPVQLTLTDPNGASTTVLTTVTVALDAAQTATTWTGAASTNWADCANWRYGLVPTAALDATLPAGLARYPTVPTGFPTDVRTLTIAAGAGLSIPTGGELRLYGSLSSDLATPLNGRVRFADGPGSPTTATVRCPGGLTEMVADKTTTALVLADDLPVSGTLTCANGVLNTGAYTITLGPVASLAETTSSYITGAVQTTRALNTTAANSFGGLGLTLQPSGPVLPGSTFIRRTTGLALSGAGGSSSALRYFDIRPVVDTGLNVALTLQYRDGELNGIAESALVVFKSESGPTGPWAQQATIVDAVANTASVSGVTRFSLWTLGSVSAPLPVELTSFTAQPQDSDALLRWATASELNSAQFEVEASADGQTFGRVGTVAAAGSLQARNYTFVDKNVARYGTTLVYYRLRQVDLDGTATYSPVRNVAVGRAGLALFPNPALHGAATLTGAGAGQAVQVLDAVGRVIATATTNEAGTAALKGLATGLYLVRVGASTMRLAVE